jgi:LysR family transcriptional regulator (chromosome initiation inhibitor)
VTLQMFDYALLHALASVVREGSFERAAKVLNLTPSAVSQRVRLLEERCGQVLVVRDQPTRATPAGLALCRHVEAVALLEQGLQQREPGLLDEPVGPVTLPLAVNADSLATWFVPAAVSLSEQLGVLLDLQVEDQDDTADHLRSGQVVGAVTALAKPVPGCRSVPLGSLRYRVTASPAFVARYFAQGVTPAALAQAPCLTFSRRDRLPAQWLALVQAAHVCPPIHWLPSTQAFVDASLAGLGWGTNPEPLVQAALAAGTLVELQPEATLEVPLYWQCRQGLPVAAALTQAVVAAAARCLLPSQEAVR